MAAIMMDKGCFNEVVKLPLPYLRKLNTRSAKLSIWTRSNLCLLHLAAVLIHIEHGRYWCYKLSLSWSPLLLTDYILQETFHLICQEEKWSRQGQYVAPVSLILYVHQYRSLVETWTASVQKESSALLVFNFRSLLMGGLVRGVCRRFSPVRNSSQISRGSV